MKKRNLWVAIAMMIVAGTVRVDSQVFDLYEIEMWGRATSDQQPHPKSQALVLSVPEDVDGWRACLEYTSWAADVVSRETRMIASCEVWRGDQLLGTQEWSTMVAKTYGYYSPEPYAYVCTCNKQPIDHLEEGDIVRCDVRFRHFAAMPEGNEVYVSVAVAETSSAGCPEWW